MTWMIKLISVIILFNFSILLVGQNFSVSNYLDELNIKLELIDEKRLARGTDMLKQAFIEENKALEMLSAMDEKEILDTESSNYRKMLKFIMNANIKYQEGHAIIYTVFYDNCDKFRTDMKKMNHYASGLNKAKYYENKGESSISRANLIREILLEADKPEWIQYKMHEAFELEKLAIRDKGRALQIFQDFPVEYNYNWENDVTLEELARFFKNPVVKLPPEEVFKKLPPDEKRIPDGGPIDFRVQIAAHTVQLTQDYIKTFYTDNDTVSEVLEGAWFKYQLGTFDNFQDAEKLRKSCRVPRAFIVAYQDNKKISIKKALAILQDFQ